MRHFSSNQTCRASTWPSHREGSPLVPDRRLTDRPAQTMAPLDSLPTADTGSRQLTVKLLQHVERLLSLSVLRDKSLAVVAVLKHGQVPVRRAEVFQDPGTGAA